MKRTKVFIIISHFLILLGCDDFLDVPPQKSLVIPKTMADLQGILDDYINLIQDPTVGEISADDYFLTSEDWASLYNEGDRRTYSWEKDYLFGTGTATEWLNVYRNVYSANTVLDILGKTERDDANMAEWDNLKGQSLFLRARSFLSIAFIWAKAYDPTTSSSDLGIPLRFDPDFNVSSKRSSLKETYEAIVQDLEEAVDLLPDRPFHVTRASRPAALALLARTYLFMQEYDRCLEATNRCLTISNGLMDFNELDSADAYPVPQFNKEVLYVSYLANPEPLTISKAKIDSNLYRSYESNDLRKQIYFNSNTDGSVGFKGSYHSDWALFSGLAIDEVYLMRAECNARIGQIASALEDVNILLKSRWNNTTTFIPKVASNLNEAVNLVIAERRKELLMRGIRWPEVKRLNQNGGGIIMRRNLNNMVLQLKPNDLRYELPIPEDIIRLTGMPQNPR